MRSPRDAAPPTRLRHVHTVATARSRPATGSPPPPHRRTPRAVNAPPAPARCAPPLPPLSPLFVGCSRFDRDAPRRRVVSAAALADEAAVAFDDAFLDDDADWAAAAGDAGEPAPGPPVAILAGFRDGEPALVRRALDEAGLSALPVVPASHALLLLPARDALHAAREPDWSAPRAANAPRGGGVGARRAVLFGGVTLADQAAALAAIDAAVGGGSVVPAEADELTWASVRAGDVLAAAVKDVDADDAAAARARRRGPPLVDALPPVEDVLAAAGIDVHGVPGGGGVVVDVEPAVEEEPAAAEPQPPSPSSLVPPDWRDRAAAGGADFLGAIAGNAVGARAGAAPAWQGGDGDDGDDDDDAPAAAPPGAGLMPGGGGSVLDAVAAGEAAPPPPPLVERGDDETNVYLQAAMAADAAAARAAATAPPRRERPPPAPPAPDAADVFMRAPSAAADAAAAGPATTKPPPVTLAPVGLDPGEDAAHDAVVADLDAKFRALPASDKAALAARMAEEARSPTRDAIAAAVACGLSPDEIKRMVDDAAAAAAEAGGLAVPWASMAKMGLDPTPEEAAAAEAGDDE